MLFSLKPLLTNYVLTSFTNSPCVSLFVFIAFPYSAKAAFVIKPIVPLHNIDSDPYGLYNTCDGTASGKKRSFLTLSIPFKRQPTGCEYVYSHTKPIKRIGVGVWGVFKNRRGLVGVMMETLYIIGVIIVGFCISFKLLYDLRNAIEDGLDELDSKLAMAIKSVVEQIPGMGENEPINPIQMAIGQLIANMSQQQQNPAMKVIQRDEKGLFVKED